MESCTPPTNHWQKKIRFELDFFAAPGGNGPCLTLCQDPLSIQFKFLSDRSKKYFKSNVTDDPKFKIRIEDSDFVLLSGVGDAALRKHFNLVENKAVVSGICDSNSQRMLPLISKSVYLSILENRLRRNPSCINISTVGSLCDKLGKKLFVQMFPLPTPNLVDQEHFSMQHFGADLGRFLSWRYCERSRLISEIHSATSFEILDYDKKWIRDGFFPDEFATQDAWHPKVGKWFILNHLSQLSL